VRIPDRSAAGPAIIFARYGKVRHQLDARHAGCPEDASERMGMEGFEMTSLEAIVAAISNGIFWGSLPWPSHFSIWRVGMITAGATGMFLILIKAI
jgi:hypothetical protein